MSEKTEVQKWKPKELYDFLNGRYFRSKLPDIPVHWSKKFHRGRRRSIMGTTWFEYETHTPVKITLNPDYRNKFVLWAGTLIHEMVHVEQWKVPERYCHGRKFEKRIRQLVARGAYKGLL